MSPLELKEYRKKHKFTQTELGKLVGVSLRAVQNWEAGINKIPESVGIILKKSTDSVQNPDGELYSHQAYDVVEDLRNKHPEDSDKFGFLNKELSARDRKIFELQDKLIRAFEAIDIWKKESGIK